MSVRLAALLFLAAVSLTSCGGPKKEIVGKWRVDGDASGVVWEFHSNGSVTSGGAPGRYSFGDNNRLKIETRSATFVRQFEINRDHMTWREPSGAKTELVRVK